MLEIGSILSGRYEIIEKIGAGGMAVVFRGRDKKLERFVTVKVLRDEFTGDEDFISRFRTEACSAAKLSHPNIVRVYDVGQEENIYYIVMEYIHGDTLKLAIQEKAPFDTKSTLNVAIQIASALSHAHKNHIVHRDIKPQNILIDTEGVVKVTDFGIARAATSSTMTTTANAAGSVHYFSPEQARGGYVDEKSDIYSVGITMYEMVTGKVPFQGSNSVAIALKHINDEMPDMRQFNPNVSKSLEGIIKKCTRKRADERYSTIDLLIEDLIHARTDSSGSFITGLEVPEKVSGLAAGAAAGLAAAKGREKIEGVSESNTEQEIDYLSYGPRRSRQMNESNKFSNPEMPPKAPSEDLPVRSRRKESSARSGSRAEGLPESGVGFDKYSRKLKISHDDDYEKEYEDVEPVKQSRPPRSFGMKKRNPRQEEDYYNEHDKSQEKKVIIAAIVTALVLISAISVFGYQLLTSTGGGLLGNKADIHVPSFIGLSFEAAQADAEKLNLKLVQESEDYDQIYEKGMIISQTVEDGTTVKKGTEIGVKVSLGLLSVDMPDLVGKTEKVARDRLSKEVGADPTVRYEYDDEAELNTVISQFPDAGTSVNSGSTVRLTISKGEENKPVKVPDVEGLTESQAKKKLESFDLVVGDISYAESKKVEEGLVITQTEEAGKEIAKNSVVNLVVSSGKAEEVEKPEEPETPVVDEVEKNKPPVQTPDVPEPPKTTSTREFLVSAPATGGETLHVKVVKTDESGTTTILDEEKSSSDFPFTTSVSGSGQGQVQCYVDGVQQWSENVNFSE